MESTNRKAIRTAIFSFKYSLIIGTLLFLSYFVFKEGQILLLGLGYIGIAVIINLIVLFILLINLITATENRSEILKAMCLLLLNIPIAYFYFWVLTNLQPF